MAQPEPEPAFTTTEPPRGRRINVSFSPWLIVGALLVVIVAMLLLWRPWQNSFGEDSRTVEVTGTATLKAEPDEFIFYPAYEFKNPDQAAALAELTAKSDQVVAELKKLGVAEKNIKTNAAAYGDRGFLPTAEPDGTNIYTLNITAIAPDRALAQKVQDFLVTTNPVGAITPHATFSTAKQKELENKARDQATKDARAKAEQSAKNLGFEVAAVKSVTDGTGFGGPVPLLGRDQSVDSAEPAKLGIQPGENDLSYSVVVVYFIK